MRKSKHYFVFLLFLPLLFIHSGCNSNSSDDSNFTLEATLASRAFIGEANSELSEENKLVIRGIDGDINNSENLSVSVTDFNGVGEYDLAEMTSNYWKIIGGDGIARIGYNQDSQPNSIRITHYDEGTGIIRGEFDIRHLAVSSFDDTNWGEEYKVKGRFETKLSDIQE